VLLSQFLEAFFQVRLVQRVQHDEAFAFLSSGTAVTTKVCSWRGQFLRGLDFDVRHHLAAIC